MLKTWITKFPVLLLLVSTSYLNVTCRRVLVNPEADLTLEERIRRHGYPVETHQIETEDGYLLSAYRIPHGRQTAGNDSKNKSIVMLLNGMGGSPHNFITLGTGRAAAFYFADKGMDVWLFAGRGIEGSFQKKHKKFDWNKDPEYWSYSLEDIGVYDVTATIDFILNYSGQKKMSLIGHSAGGHECFCMLSQRPEYNEKVKLLINWGSTPILKYMDYPIIRLGAEASDLFKAIWKYFGLVEIIPLYDSFFKPFMKAMCSDPDWQKVCVLLSGVFGSHQSVIQRSADIQLMLNNVPRVAVRQAFHFMDNIKNGTFRRYDFGPKKNMRLYGQRDPPHYNLSAVTAPVAFYLGEKDDIIVKEDAYESAKLLPNTVLVYDVAFSKFSHVDFAFGQNATELVYEPTYRLMNDYDRGIVPPPVKIPSNYLE